MLRWIMEKQSARMWARFIQHRMETVVGPCQYANILSVSTKGISWIAGPLLALRIDSTAFSICKGDNMPQPRNVTSRVMGTRKLSVCCVGTNVWWADMKNQFLWNIWYNRNTMENVPQTTQHCSSEWYDYVQTRAGHETHHLKSEVWAFVTERSTI
jgi:hypothetical protein